MIILAGRKGRGVCQDDCFVTFIKTLSCRNNVNKNKIILVRITKNVAALIGNNFVTNGIGAAPKNTDEIKIKI
jgi:hypothetical protein